jgi:hypothetical protein
MENGNISNMLFTYMYMYTKVGGLIVTIMERPCRRESMRTPISRPRLWHPP